MKQKIETKYEYGDILRDKIIRRIRTTMNFDPKIDSHPEPRGTVDMAVPDMSLTIAEIMVRHQQGRPLTLRNGMDYIPENEDLYPGFENYDKVEQASMILEHRAKVKELEESARDKMAARKAAKLQKRKQDDEVAKRAQQVVDAAETKSD